MATRIDYTKDAYLDEDKCPHTGHYIGTMECFYCIWSDHHRTAHQMIEEIRNNKMIVLCNHPEEVEHF